MITASLAATVNDRLPHVHLDGLNVPVIVVDTVGISPAGMPVYVIVTQDGDNPSGYGTMECRADDLCYVHAAEGE